MKKSPNPARVKKVQELRRSNAATPVASKKVYTRKKPVKPVVVEPIQEKPNPRRLIRTKSFFFRIIATFIASGLSIVGIGSIFGLDLLKSVLFAGAIGVVTVTEGIARAYLTDGKLTLTEMNRAFKNYDSKLQEEGSGMYGSCHCTNCCPNTFEA